CAARKSRRDLLKQPAVSIRILKRRKRRVGTSFRIRPGDARPKQPVKMKNLRHLDAATQQISARFLDIVHNEVKVSQRTRSSRSDPFANMNRRFRTRRSELHNAVIG